MNKNLHLFLFLVLIFYLTGCGMKSFLPTSSVVTEVNDLSTEKKLEKVYPLFTDEIRLADIPFPIGVKVYNLSATPENNKLILKFKSKLALFDICAFYRAEMEYLGWQENAVFNGHEAALVFSKPSKICVISLRSLYDDQSEVALFVGPNRKI